MQRHELDEHTHDERATDVDDNGPVGEGHSKIFRRQEIDEVPTDRTCRTTDTDSEEISDHQRTPAPALRRRLEAAGAHARPLCPH